MTYGKNKQSVETKDLFPLIIQQDTVLVDARLLHQKLEVGKDFSNWIKSRISEFRFVENHDYFSCSPNLASKIWGGNNKKDYHLTLDMAKELAMLERNEIGRNIRRYFIAKEKEVRGVPKQLMPNEKDLFKGLKSERINNRVLYPFIEIRKRCGYSIRSSSSNYKLRYGNHLILIGKLLYCTTEMANHLWHSKAVISNRHQLKLYEPIIPALPERSLFND